MQFRYYQDPDTGCPHLYNHGVSEDEAEYVIQHSNEDRPGKEGSRVCIGATESGRHLRIVYVPDPGGDSCFVVTGYELTGKPLMAYRRRRRRKGKR